MEKTITLPDGKQYTAADIQEKIIELKSRKADLPLERHAQIIKWIQQLQKIMDELRSQS